MNWSFGYKRHVFADDLYKLVRTRSETLAGVHVIQEESGFLDKVPKKGTAYPDRGYDSRNLTEIFAVVSQPKHCRLNFSQGGKQRKSTKVSISQACYYLGIFGSICNVMSIPQRRVVGLKRAVSDLPWITSYTTLDLSSI